MNPILSRRELFRLGSAAAAVAVGGSLAGCAAHRGAGSGSTVRTQLSWLKTVTFAGFYLADHKGWYRGANVSSTLLAGGPNIADTASVVAGGGADVALTDVSSLVKAHSQGADLVMIGAVFQQSPGGFLSLARKPIRTVQDMVGARIGLTPGAEVVTDAVFKVNGLTPKYTKVPIGGDTKPLLEGACDAMACYVTAQPVTLSLQHIENVTVTQSELGVPDYALGFVVRRDTLSKRRDVLVRYLRQTLRGYEYDNAHPQEGSDLAVQDYGKGQGLDPTEQLAENKIQLGLMSSDDTKRGGLGRISLDHVAGPIYRGLRATGLANLPDPAKLIDTSLLDEVYNGKTSLL